MTLPSGWILLPYGCLQLSSIYLFYRRVAIKRSNYAILLDLAIYTCVSCLARTISDLLYLLAPSKAQFANRYPLYPQLILLHPLIALGLGSSVASCMLLSQMLQYRHKDTEVSLLCKVTLTCLAGTICFALYLFSYGLATVNCLDLADLFSFISLFAWSCRLIPQVSVNWFYDNFLILHKYFLRFEAISISYVFVTYWLFALYGVQWHAVPLNAPLYYVAGFSMISLCILVFQSKIYPSRLGLPR